MKFIQVDDIEIWYDKFDIVLTDSKHREDNSITMTRSETKGVIEVLNKLLINSK